MNILHIGDEMSWRGGENQIRYLIEGQKSEPGVQHFVAYPKGSRGLEVFSQQHQTMTLPSRNPNHPISILKLVQFAKKNNIQLVDAHSSTGHSFGLWLKFFLPQLKLVIHRRVANPIKKNIFSKQKYLNKKIDKYVAISDCIGQLLIGYGVPRNKVQVIHSAIDTQPYTNINRSLERNRISTELGAPQDTIWLGNASAFTAEKKPAFLIQVLIELDKSGLDFQCLLAGDGVLLDECKALVKKNGLGKKVHFLGHIQQVPQLLTALDILIFPSSNEGLGTLLLDSIAAGTCIVASRVGGIPEVVIDQKTGLTADPDDLNSFVGKVRSLIIDPELRSQLVNNAQKHIEKEFSIANMVDGNLKVYRGLLKQK